MAGEISWGLSLNASKNGQQAILDKSGTLSLDGQQMVSATQNIGTTAEAVSLPADLQKLEKERLAKNETRQEFFKQQDFEKVAAMQMEILDLENKLSARRREWPVSRRPVFRK